VSGGDDNQRVLEGALYNAETKRRTIVAIDDELRRFTEATLAAFVSVFKSGQTPAPTL
jgi:CRISPR-associated exonuclease Cas4